MNARHNSRPRKDFISGKSCHLVYAMPSVHLWELRIRYSSLNQFIVVYFHDILIHIKHEEEHVQHLSLVLQALRETKLYLNLKSCEFVTNKPLFLRFIINSDGVSTDEQKVTIIREQPTRTNVQVKRFHGLVTFYRCFIKSFSSIVAFIKIS